MLIQSYNLQASKPNSFFNKEILRDLICGLHARFCEETDKAFKETHQHNL